MQETTWLDNVVGTHETRADFEAERLVQVITAALYNAISDNGITQAEVASRIGKAPAFVSQVLSGRRNATLHTIAKIAYAAGVRVSVEVEPIVALSHRGSLCHSVVLPMQPRPAVEEGRTRGIYDALDGTVDDGLAA